MIASIIILSILVILSYFFIFKLNSYISVLENEIDELENETSQIKRVLEESIKEDYLIKDEGKIKVKKPRISKKDI